MERLMGFKRHPIYFVLHVLFGFIGYFYPDVLYAALAYQFLQYIFNIRVFMMEMKIEKGNSVTHTGIKLAEVAAGYGLAMLYTALNTI
jgi:hypothetical protein